jgi:hypothetical protein
MDLIATQTFQSLDLKLNLIPDREQHHTYPFSVEAPKAVNDR